MNISPNDKREYKFITLNNKLRVMLIHDDESIYSSASMCVNVGSLYDPLEYQGLAHFLEHMLFMGSKKYPKENEFSNYINKYGGSQNAYTDAEITNYFFDIQSEYFEKALDIFSRFFIDPLLLPDAVEREVNAVASEHSKNITNDHRRLYGILREIADPKSIYTKFATGNLDSLYNGGKKDNLLNELKKFHDKYYSANIMTLCVLGPQSLSDLELLVLNSFNDVPNLNINYFDEIMSSYGKNCAFPHDYDMDKLAKCKLSDKRKLNTLKFIKILPINKDTTINILWELPTYNHLYKYKMISFLSNIIGHESENSILDQLKKYHLASGLAAGPIKMDSNQTIFCVTISLTDKGYTYRHNVIRLLHEYIDLMKKQCLPKEFYDEYKIESYNKFLFPHKYNGIDYVSKLTVNMTKYKEEDYISGSSIMNEYDDDACKLYLDYLNLMQPETSIVIMSSPKYINLLYNKEKWYEIEYSIENMVHLESSEESVEFEFNIELPKLNPFTPTDLSIKDNIPTEYPINCNNQRIYCWYKFINKYNVPKASVYIRLFNKSLFENNIDQTKLLLFVLCKMDELNNILYPAHVSGYVYNVGYDILNKSIDIVVSGYNQKLNEVLSILTKDILDNIKDVNHFNLIRETHIKETRNLLFAEPYQLASSNIDKYLLKSYCDPIEKIKILENISFDEVNTYGTNILASEFDMITMLAEGNIDISDVDSYINTLKVFKTINTKNILDADYNVSEKHEIIECVCNDKENNSSCNVMFYCGKYDKSIAGWKELYIGSALVEAILSDNFFEDLRTKQQLGYIVGMSLGILDNVHNSGITLTFCVQSDLYGGKDLYEKIDKFIKNNNIIDQLSDDDFDDFKTSLINDLLKPKQNIMEELILDLSPILSDDLMFDRSQLIADRIKSYTIDELRNFYNTTIINGKPIVSMVYGNKFMDEYNGLKKIDI